MNWLYALLIVAAIIALCLFFGKGVSDYIKRVFNELKKGEQHDSNND